MALSTSQTGTADFTSNYTRMTEFTLTGGADAATVNLREGSLAGDIKYVVKAAINTTVHLHFGDDGVMTDDRTVWAVDLSAGTTPQMTITGF